MLDLIDVHGGAYRRDLDLDAVRSEAASAALDHLAEAQGIIYFFDPIGERYNRDSAAYVRGTVNELLKRAAKNAGDPGGTFRTRYRSASPSSTTRSCSSRRGGRAW